LILTTKNFQVDIYGGCGSFKCDRSNESACWHMTERDYFFYLSFENSICVDYVTEKFFNVMTKTIVPIVLGGSDYEGPMLYLLFSAIFTNFRRFSSISMIFTNFSHKNVIYIKPI
jgi:hypothetical protein